MSITSLLLTALLQGATLTPVSAAAADPNDEVKCRRIEVTGSIARKEKVCKTIGEWRRLADSGNGVARAVVEYSTGRPSGQ
ncbi:hypothetical protein [Sphingomonas sp. TZW2008]|uniref:hypothetical protein n=1 Tax=Sphingomonas sp. TZW2008 TaxID=1917973 RepID=UPI000A27063B|nr:hypothetical protein [Sphingomonas sp. TZW2008]